MRELSPLYLLNLAWRRIYYLVIVGVIFAALTFSYFNFFAAPTYRAEASVLITNGGSILGIAQGTNAVTTISSNDITASQNIMETFADFLEEPIIYNDMLTQMEENNHGKNYTSDSLAKSASISIRSEGSLFLDIKYSANDPDEAVYLCTLFTNLIPLEFEVNFPSAIVCITKLPTAATQTGPKTTMFTTGAFLVGVIFIYALFLIADLLDNAIAGEEGYTATFELPLLGSVPYFGNEEDGGYKKYSYKRYGYGYGKYSSYGNYSYTPSYEAADASNKITKEVDE